MTPKDIFLNKFIYTANKGTFRATFCNVRFFSFFLSGRAFTISSFISVQMFVLHRNTCFKNSSSCVLRSMCHTITTRRWSPAPRGGLSVGSIASRTLHLVIIAPGWHNIIMPDTIATVIAGFTRSPWSIALMGHNACLQLPLKSPLSVPKFLCISHTSAYWFVNVRSPGNYIFGQEVQLTDLFKKGVLV